MANCSDQGLVVSMRQRYLIPTDRHRVEEEIRRSRFITTIAPATTVEEARAFIHELKHEFDTASHNCWAYLIGVPGSTAQVGLSDDGEPHGTAGRPMLTVLLHSGIGDIVAVVTRYFGGVKLGKGGLVKAYSGGVQYALETVSLTEKTLNVLVDVVINYSNVTQFQRMLRQYEAEALHQDYSVDVRYQLRMPMEHVARFSTDLADLTNGQAQVTVQS